jgi:hypothetical protein
MMFTGISSISANADETEKVAQPVNEVITSTGLISYYWLTITGGTKKIYITAATHATETMAKVGFTNISIQRSANGYSGWTEEVPLNDDYVMNTYYHEKNAELHSVTGGYYYRVVLDHYAKEKGLLFPESESITNYSNVVWVPAT